MSNQTGARELFTIGHSNHQLAEFLAMLKMHGITVVADVRSSPYSRYNPQYNRENLRTSLRGEDVSYVYLGAELGARSTDPACYENGAVRFDLLAASELFQDGLKRLAAGIPQHRIALMCGEKDPITCHRMLLICRQLRRTDIAIRHILEDGSLEDNQEAEKRLLRALKMPPRDLFHTPEEILEKAYDQQGRRIAPDGEGHDE